MACYNTPVLSVIGIKKGYSIGKICPGHNLDVSLPRLARRRGAHQLPGEIPCCDIKAPEFGADTAVLWSQQHNFEP